MTQETLDAIAKKINVKYLRYRNGRWEASDDNYNWWDDSRLNKYPPLPKQETLEEAAERLAKDAYKKHSVKDDKLSLDEQIQRSGGFIVGFKEGMIEGAKWQAEQFKYYLQKLNDLCGKKKL